MILEVLFSLYGLVELDVHWLFTCHGHYRNRLHLRANTHDFCILYSPALYSDLDKTKKRKSKEYMSADTSDPKRIVTMQVNDTLFVENL